MPILLDDLSANVSSALTSPTFFSPKLTGNGKRQGFLYEGINPSALNPKKSVDLTNAHLPKISMTHNGAEYYHIPMHFFPTTWYPFATSQAYDTFTATPDIDRAVPVVKTRNREVYMQLVPYSIELVMTPPPPGSATRLKDRSIVVVYDLQICHINPNDAPENTYHVYQSNIRQNVHMVKNPNSPHSTVIHSLVTRNIADTAHMVLNHLAQIFVQTTVDIAAWDKYFDEYSLFDEVQALATIWETDLPTKLESIFAYTDNHARPMDEHTYAELSKLLSRLEDYKIPLQLYNQIYANIIKYYTPDIATELCKENLNLLLHNTLSKLDKDKPQLSHLPAIANKPAIDPKFSIEQRAAITTEEPLALVQSVAGSGKSSVILARIQYMVDAGVNPEDITVISFTNAAADHIKELNKDVHSMTFSLMIHKIYTENFPNHNLSSLDTLINTINIYLPRDDFAMEFSKKLIDLARTSAHSFTDMNNFVERNYADVIRVLDTVGQTTLEMEIIICYQSIDNLVEPADVLSRYLIIDEVQDNSIFEFVYALKYVAKHKESLFIVGGSSLT